MTSMLYFNCLCAIVISCRLSFFLNSNRVLIYLIINVEIAEFQSISGNSRFYHIHEHCWVPIVFCLQGTILNPFLLFQRCQPMMT